MLGQPPAPPPAHRPLHRPVHPPADPTSVRRWNERVVAGALLGGGPLRVAELAETTGLTAASVRDVLRTLAAKSWVTSSAATQPRMGRPARTYRLRDVSAWILGVDLGGHTVRAVVSDAAGKVRPIGEVAVPQPRTTLASTRDAVAALMTQAGAELAADQVWTTGLAVSGVLDRDGTVVRSIALPQLEGRRPARVLADLLPGHVQTWHDTRAALWAEHREGAARGVRDVLLVHLGRRPSLALLLDGRPYDGAHGNAGELSLSELFPAGDTYDWADAATHPDDPQGAAVRAALAGDPDAVAGAAHLLDQIAPQLAFAIGLIDPRLVVVGGALGPALSPELSRLEAQIAARVQSPPELAITALDQFATALGAAHLAREELWRLLLDHPGGVVPLTADGYAAAVSSAAGSAP